MYQCQAGIIDLKTRKSVKKPTEFMASDEKFVAYLRPRRCEGNGDSALNTRRSPTTTLPWCRYGRGSW
jgi:hypothetical protein